jgi:hypothetical protein
VVEEGGYRYIIERYNQKIHWIRRTDHLWEENEAVGDILLLGISRLTVPVVLVVVHSTFHPMTTTATTVMVAIFLTIVIQHQ